MSVPEPTPLPNPQRARRLAVLAMVLAGSVPLAFAIDIQIARWVHAGPPLGDAKHVIRLSEAFAHGSGIFLILLAAAAIDPRGWRILPRLAIGAYGAGLIADILKLVWSRTRPEKFDVLNQGVWESFLGFFAWRNSPTWAEALSRDIQSFPSGHAACAAGLACALSRHYPWASGLFVLLTLLACTQRVAASAHYLSDVLAGAAIGVVVNLLLELPRLDRWLGAIETQCKKKPI